MQGLGFPIGLAVDQQILDGGIVLDDGPAVGISVDGALIRSEHQTGS